MEKKVVCFGKLLFEKVCLADLLSKYFLSSLSFLELEVCFLRKLCLLQDLKGCLSWICLINLDLESLILVWLTFGESFSVVSSRGGLGGITAVNWFAIVTVLHMLHARKG